MYITSAKKKIIIIVSVVLALVMLGLGVWALMSGAFDTRNRAGEFDVVTIKGSVVSAVPLTRSTIPIDICDNTQTVVANKVTSYQYDFSFTVKKGWGFCVRIKDVSPQEIGYPYAFNTAVKYDQNTGVFSSEKMWQGGYEWQVANVDCGLEGSGCSTEQIARDMPFDDNYLILLNSQSEPSKTILTGYIELEDGSRDSIALDFCGSTGTAVRESGSSSSYKYAYAKKIEIGTGFCVRITDNSIASVIGETRGNSQNGYGHLAYEWQLAGVNCDYYGAVCSGQTDELDLPSDAGLYFIESGLGDSRSRSSMPIDSRIGVTHIGGMYPDIGEGFLMYGLDEASELGFQTFEIGISRAVCEHWEQEKYPEGTYQYNPCAGVSPWTKTLTEIASTEMYTEVWEYDFDTLFVTAEAFGSNAFVSLTGSNPDWKWPYVYEEFYDFAEYLLQNYGDSDKVIVIQPVNELDWQMIQNKPNWNVSPYPEPDQAAIQSAILYLDNVTNAVNEAKADNPGTSLKLYVGCEVNMVWDAMPQNGGKSRAITQVIPNTECDLVGYSAYETAEARQLDSQDFVVSLNYMKQQSPDGNVFGSNNVYVSEFGVPHGGREPQWNKSEVQAATFTERRIDEAFERDVPYFLYWQIYDNDCSQRDPEVSDCRGFWLIKPDLSMSKVYTTVLKNYR